MSIQKKSMMPGICLILIGMWFLAHHLMRFSRLWPKTYPLLLLFFGVFLFWEAVRNQRKGTIFWGTFLFLLGLFYLLRNFQIIPYMFVEDYWPFFLIAMGFGFFILFILHPQNWGNLFPAGLFLLFGFAAASHTLYGQSMEWLEQILQYWPILLIFMGIGLLVSGLKKM